MQRSHKVVMSLAAGAVILAVGGPATARVEGDTIIIGSAISLTGKYSTNGQNTQRGYDLGAKRINEMGGVKVGGKSYKIKIIYYDDESTGGRAAQLAERLIKQDGVKFMLGPYSSGMTKAVTPDRSSSRAGRSRSFGYSTSRGWGCCAPFSRPASTRR